MWLEYTQGKRERHDGGIWAELLAAEVKALIPPTARLLIPTCLAPRQEQEGWSKSICFHGNTLTNPSSSYLPCHKYCIHNIFHDILVPQKTVIFQHAVCFANYTQSYEIWYFRKYICYPTSLLERKYVRRSISYERVLHHKQFTYAKDGGDSDTWFWKNLPEREAGSSWEAGQQRIIFFKGHKGTALHSRSVPLECFNLKFTPLILFLKTCWVHTDTSG